MNKILISLLTLAIAGTVSAAEAGKSKAKTEEAEKKEESKLSLALYSEMYTGMADMNRGDSSGVSSYNLVSVGYKLNETDSISVNFNINTSRAAVAPEDIYRIAKKDMPVFGKSEDDKKKEGAFKESSTLNVRDTQRFSAGDAYITYSRSKMNIFGERGAAVRLYVPTSDSSSLVGKYKLRGDTSLKKELSEQLSVSYSISPRINFYTRSSSGQAAFELLQGPTLSQKITDKLSASYGAYLYNAFTNTGDALKLGDLSADGTYNGTKESPVEDNTLNLAIVSAGVNYALKETISVGAIIEQERNIESSSSYLLFNEEETAYKVTLTISL